jgi:hypothetical protein
VTRLLVLLGLLAMPVPVSGQTPAAPAAPRLRRPPPSHLPPEVVLYDAPPTVDGTPIDDMARWMANGGKPLAPTDLLPPATPTDEALLLPVELSCRAIGGSTFAFYVGTVNPPPLVAPDAPACQMIATEGNPGQRIYWQVIAKNAVGQAASPVRSFVVGGSTIVPVGADLTSGGDWIGAKRGTEGYWLATDGRSLPSYATVTVTPSQTYTWAAATADGRGLRKPGVTGGNQYLAACWYSDTDGAFDVAVTIADGRIHQVALYIVDWDQTTRTERVDAIDATSGAVVDSRSLRDYHGGGYLLYEVSGRVTFRVTHLGGGHNAVLSGIFFDPPLTNLQLTWDASPARDAVLRYEIGYSTTRGTYPTVHDNGLQTTWTVDGIPHDGTAWWFAIRAVNAAGPSPFGPPIALLYRPPAPTRR